MTKRWVLKRRENDLVHAAAEGLYWLKQLESDLQGHLMGETMAVENLEAVLGRYKEHGITYQEY